jgi:hypothetical protein
VNAVYIGCFVLNIRLILFKFFNYFSFFYYFYIYLHVYTLFGLPPPSSEKFDMDPFLTSLLDKFSCILKILLALSSKQYALYYINVFPFKWKSAQILIFHYYFFASIYDSFNYEKWTKGRHQMYVIKKHKL